MRNIAALLCMLVLFGTGLPASAELRSSTDAFMTTTRMEPGTVVNFGGTWVRSFTIDSVSPNPPIGSGATINSFFDVWMETSPDGGLTWSPVTGTGSMTLTPALRSNIQGIQTWASPVTAMNATTSGILFRKSPSFNSTGTNTYKPVGDNYIMNSFFDIFTELSIDSGETWQPVTGISQNSGASFTPGTFPMPIGVANDTPVVITTAVNLFQPRIGQGRTATVNDFHVRFRVNRWERMGYSTFLGLPMNRNYLNPQGFWGPGTVTSYDREGDYIEIEWVFPTMEISDLSMPWFGFTFGNGSYRTPGGFRYQAVEWYWTYNGVRVTAYDNDLDVWQDWIKVWNPLTCRWEIQDVIVNRNTVPRGLTLISGQDMAPVSPLGIFGVATGGIYPPNPQPPVGPIIGGGGGTVVTPWPWPGNDPDYFMYYTVADGATPGVAFRNAVELAPESPAACPTADLNGDCFVNFLDLAVLASQWLAGTI
jgi:hypothetical protein